MPYPKQIHGCILLGMMKVLTEYKTLGKLNMIWGEPKRAPNTRETGSGVYIYIYIYIYLFILCVILHGNDLMRMLNHHALERDR